MRRKDGFTVMEIMVVLVLIGALVVGVTTLLDPMEQIKRSQDASSFLLIKDTYGAIARVMIDAGIPWNDDLTGVPLTSEKGMQTVNLLIEAHEFPSDSVATHEKQLSGIFLTAPKEGNKYTLCFKPVSRTYQRNKENKYDREGSGMEGCPSAACYTCLKGGVEMHESERSSAQGGSSSYSSTPNPPSATSRPTPSPTPLPGPTTNPACLNFNPEYPVYAWTCNYSSKWAMYGCTNYCVRDLGCGGGNCKPDERRLEKHYYHAEGQSSSADAQVQWFIPDVCDQHLSETLEEYCISGREANCGFKNYSSYLEDYHWGCVNPRRPYEWITYQ